MGPIVAGDVMKASLFVGEEEVETFTVPVEDRKDQSGNPW